MRVLKSLLVCAAPLLLSAGCQTIPPGAERGPDGTMAYYVPIETSVAGAKIEVNGEMVGESPVTLKIFGDPDGTFHDFGSYDYVVRAYPVHTNQFVQSRVFRTGRMFSGEDRIPSQIYFDLNQPPQVFVPVPVYPPVYYHPSPFFYDPWFHGPRVHIVPRHHHHHHSHRGGGLHRRR